MRAQYLKFKKVLSSLKQTVVAIRTVPYRYSVPGNTEYYVHVGISYDTF